MNKKFKLSDIVNIRSGMVVPKTVNNDERQLPDAYVRMVGTSDYDDGNLRTDLEANVLIKPAIEKNFLQYNEVLFNAKGRRFFAALFRNEYSFTIASASFLVLTIKDDKIILPEFLVWYLNHSETLKVFNSKMTTQNIPSITKQELGELEIIIPNFETQKKIVKLDLLKKEQITIQKELITLKANLINTVTYKKLKNEC
jgi:restriction endonuclease S subunit